jgi:hypothetical protein
MPKQETGGKWYTETLPVEVCEDQAEWWIIKKLV